MSWKNGSDPRTDETEAKHCRRAISMLEFCSDVDGIIISRFNQALGVACSKETQLNRYGIAMDLWLTKCCLETSVLPGKRWFQHHAVPTTKWDRSVLPAGNFLICESLLSVRRMRLAGWPPGALLG
eukprot:scaffold1484_cov173-Amphora_coffeaeformis.AAC.16